MNNKFNEKQTAVELVRIYVSGNPKQELRLPQIIDAYKQLREVVRVQEQIHNSLELNSHE